MTDGDRVPQYAAAEWSDLVGIITASEIAPRFEHAHCAAAGRAS